MVGVIEELIWISFGGMGQCMCFTCLFSALFKNEEYSALFCSALSTERQIEQL